MRTLDSTLKFSGTSDVVSVGSASAQSAAFQSSTFEVRIVSTTNCWINFGSDPTASAADGSLYLPAGVVEYYHVNPSQKVAVIRDSADGTLCVGEMTR